jgi:hypothetical protein
MTRTEQRILFTTAAFVAVLLKDKDVDGAAAAGNIVQLANLIEAFCMENVLHVPSALLGNDNAADTDQIIESHIDELKEKEETHLPEDRPTLLKLYDRLLQRKTWRNQRKIYASVNEKRLADLVLKLMDEEINDDSNKALT